MPRAFDIAAATASATIDASGKGEMIFKVSNALNRDVRVRARVVPEGKTVEKWLTADAPEKDLKADGTATFAVRIVVPAGTPPGDYAFHLLAATVSNPDEEFTEGPSVSFRVAAVPVPIRKFPWWILVVVGAVLVVGGGVAYFLLSNRGGKLGEPCQDGKCRDPWTCVTRGDKSTCLAEDGGDCQQDEECQSGLCLEKKCSALKAGDPCREGRCSFGLTCVTRGEKSTCLVAVGQKCSAPQDCISGRCDGQTCTEVPVRTVCSTVADCDGRELCVALAGGKFCLFKGGESCQGALDCASQYCRADATCANEEGRCKDNRDCRPEGFFCKEGFCRKVDGQVCATGAECASGFCTGGPDGKCAQPPPPKQCVPPCAPHLRCIDGQCRPFFFPGAVFLQTPGVAIVHDACKQGFVWREARPTDHVCVTPERRTAVRQENQLAASRRAGFGPFGPDTCKQGFVWRDAFQGDHVCVPVQSRTLAAQENQLAPSRRAQP